MVKNVIFDFGNVLVHFDPAQITRQYAADSCPDSDRALLTRVCFDRKYWDRMDEGVLDESDVVPLACAQLPERLHASVRHIFANWYRDLPEWTGMADLLLELKMRGYRLYLLSNISRTFAAHSGELSILQPFDGKLMSATVHLVKPSAAIFHRLLTQFDLLADECIFIDDAPRNIAGAQAAGIAAIPFTGNVPALRAELLHRLSEAETPRP